MGFFRELPEALINPKTETQYQQWTELPNFDKVTLFNQMKKLLKNSIDEALKPTLKALFDHFQNVLAHSNANRMAAQNCNCFWTYSYSKSECALIPVNNDPQ